MVKKKRLDIDTAASIFKSTGKAPSGFTLDRGKFKRLTEKKFLGDEDAFELSFRRTRKKKIL